MVPLQGGLAEHGLQKLLGKEELQTAVTSYWRPESHFSGFVHDATSPNPPDTFIH